MSIDFFKAGCQSTIKEKRFGLYDIEDGTPAKIQLVEEENWNAIVINDAEKEVLFTAIDNCIDILRDNGEMDNRCDVMLNYESSLFMIELKNKRDSWQAEGLSQIEATIKQMLETNEEFYFGFKKRKAIVANRKHQFPCFQDVNLEQREYFKKNYKARIQFEAQIVIK